jgi:hypothetical protein
MKATFLLALLLAAPSFGQSLSSTNRSTVPTNVLALYLVDGSAVERFLTNGTGEGLKLVPQPILSDADFVDWDVTNHTFVITPAAAIRVGVECNNRTRPFVMVAEGVPVYLGGFWTHVSSDFCGVPVVIPDLAVADCFMGVDRVPAEIWRMMGRLDPRTLDRLMTLAKTSPTTNVTLRIELGYFSSPGEDSYQEAEKRRADPRIATAVQKLFAGRNK